MSSTPSLLLESSELHRMDFGAGHVDLLFGCDNPISTDQFCVDCSDSVAVALSSPSPSSSWPFTFRREQGPDHHSES